LLSYLTIYGEEHCLDFTSFKTLFQAAGESTVGGHDVHFLDLTGLLNDAFTLNDLYKCLKRTSSRAPEQIQAAVVADSWEEEVDDTEGPIETVPAQLATPHFSNLSRLSLAHAGRCASWPDLLKLSPNLNKITHLSLAYWPRPTLTPNSSTTSMVSNHTRVSLSGSSFYADLDDDFHEAANILRRFSINTYSLQWLDLEGCTWRRALTWRRQSDQDSAVPEAPRARMDAWSDPESAAPGPAWNGAWQRLTYLNLFQGWLPAHEQSLQNLPGGVIPMQLMRWLREHGQEQQWKLDTTERGNGISTWVEREKVARAVATEIQRVRKAGKGVYCHVDFGWRKVK
jgi:hypothetical protein